MKRFKQTLLVILSVGFSLVAHAYEPADRSRLRGDIDQLKSKIRNSKDISNRDLQKLTELENQLHKSNFLDKSKDSNNRR